MKQRIIDLQKTLYKNEVGLAVCQFDDVVYQINSMGNEVTLLLNDVIELKNSRIRRESSWEKKKKYTPKQKSKKQ